jgi:hypothetical protein
MAEDYTDTDFAWAAGFLDGEGCFRVVSHPAPSGVIAWRIHLSAGQKKIEPLLKLQRMFGGAIRKHNSKNAHYWLITNPAEVRQIVPLLLPYLTVKQPEAYNLLLYARTFTGTHKLSPSTLAARKRLLTSQDKLVSYATPTILEEGAGLAWSAGFLDAEGCFTLCKDAANANPVIRSVLVSVYQLCRAPLVRLHDIFSVGSVTTTPNTMGAFAWRVYRAQHVADVVEQVRPYLLMKQREADIVSLYAKEMTYRGTTLPKITIEVRRALISELEEIRRCNAR